MGAAAGRFRNEVPHAIVRRYKVDMAMNGIARIGLALAGGGAKGAFTFGFVERCHELGIAFDAVSGTSVGGLNAWLVATGQYDQGRTLWSDVDFRGLYSPRTGSRLWVPAGALLCFAHAALRWTRGIIPFPDPTARINIVLEAVFRLLFFVPASLIWAKILLRADAAGLAAAGLLAALLCLIRPAIDLRKDAYEWRLAEMTHGLFLLIKIYLILPILLAAPLAIAIYRSRDLDLPLLQLGYAGFCLAVLVLGSLANLDDTPLRHKIREAVRLPARLPCHIAVATAKERFDPDNPLYVPGPLAPPAAYGLGHLPQTIYVPVYVSAHELGPAERELILAATAALPFGLVNSISFRGEELVDGGVCDNAPVYPLLRYGFDASSSSS